MLEIESLTKLYGVVIGVNDMSVQLPSGAYGLLGPNGSGKTTLLNIIGCIDTPSSGTLRLFGTGVRSSAVLVRVSV